jgi:hypothetical protein
MDSNTPILTVGDLFQMFLEGKISLDMKLACYDDWTAGIVSANVLPNKCYFEVSKNIESRHAKTFLHGCSDDTPQSNQSVLCFYIK